jgi:lysyl-tRNA synthetase class 1
LARFAPLGRELATDRDQSMSGERQLAEQARAWPFEEARKIVARLGGADVSKTPAKGYVLFETGYGPSGLPHIGTFGEVVRTTMVRQAFRRLSDIKTRLFCFSDDMDGLRKVPDNVPNKEMLAQHLGKPLTAVPDPFSNEHPSFGAANNARLRAFLDSFGFEYEFQSATDWYRSGRFDSMLLAMLRRYDELQAVMLPTLGEERQQSYSIFLPICRKTGRVLQVPVVKTDADAGTIVYRDEDGALVETPVTGGNVKLQWKADWAGRWFALGVDYEMYGKDLIPSAELSAKIVRILGGRPPEGFNYELFLDQDGKKISKSKGNGLSVEEWLRYAPAESLALYMHQQPRRAKRLYFDVIPRAVDEYLALVEKLPAEEPAKALENPAWHIHDGQAPDHHAAGVSFGMLLNLAGVAHTDDKDVLWQYLRRYVPGATPQNAPYLDRLLSNAIAYYVDFVKAQKKFRLPTPAERAALVDLADTLRKLPDDATAEFIQNEVYEAGKRHFAQAELRQWFKTLYEVLLGSEQGPRMGAFIKLFGRDNVVRLIDRALAGEDLGRAA